MPFTRREFCKNLFTLAAASLIRPAWAKTTDTIPVTRVIHSTGEKLPAIGMGSWITFNVGYDSEEKEKRIKVLQTFFDRGGALIDSSPMYGTSENVIGYCLSKITNTQSLFSATKVWAWGREEGIAQMEESRQLWGVNQFDLMQIHNLLDWDAHLRTLKDWKARGKIRYLGVTTSHGRRHDAMERLMKREPLDFVQFTYNIVDREAERKLLPLAAERNIAVIINRPFRGGNLFDDIQRKPLPPWASEFDCENWAQFFLKFIVSHPDVTCAIPATSRVDHMQENMGALYGRLPDARTRKRMVEYFNSL